MSLSDKQRGALRKLLQATQNREMDCDTFVEYIAIHIDNNIDDSDVRLLFEHHREICPECEEELQLVLRALGE